MRGNWAGEPFSSSGWRVAADADFSGKPGSLSPGCGWEDQSEQDSLGLQ